MSLCAKACLVLFTFRKIHLVGEPARPPCGVAKPLISKDFASIQGFPYPGAKAYPCVGMVVSARIILVTTEPRAVQQFKSVYFADHPGENCKQRSLKLAFGPTDAALFSSIKALSSEEIRRLLGHHSFNTLQADAKARATSLNAFCLNRLRQPHEVSNDLQLRLIPSNNAVESLDCNPIQATFRGGIAQPLHNWYPYLEGYSPEFVTSVLDTFAPTASRVLDPFAGTGTTPLTASRRGLMSFYCELNPLLQFLVNTKATILAMDRTERTQIAKDLVDLAKNLQSELSEYEPDQLLREAYTETFGSSEFFPATTMETCLRIRSWLDSLSCTSSVIASVASVAAVAALIPCSNLIRRGDLRFRKGSECCEITNDLPKLLSARLELMAQDIIQVDCLRHIPTLITADAKRLEQIPSLDVDVIITSPPYLNGTNYYRNTKVELWFIRSLISGRDLAAFRYQTVTAGINDVTIKKNPPPASESVDEVVRLLEDRSYDRRIPRMVLSYFADMGQVFDGLLRHCSPSSSLIIDIGDSAYAGIKVDTPRILADLLKSRGWTVDNELVLRQRLSRSGQRLRQVLLVATAPSWMPRQISSKRPARWQNPWTQFTKNLPHQRNGYSKRNWGSPLHSLCSYQGKMKPSLAYHLVRAFTRPGCRLLDPFGGVGTIPFEAASYGVKAWSFDISPASVSITAAKIRLVNPDACNDLIDNLDQFITKNRPTIVEQTEASSIRFNGQLATYFHPKTFEEILLARRFFRKFRPTSSAQQRVFACLLHILHGNRPYALSRRSHPITPFAPSGEPEYKRLTEKLSEKVARSFASEPISGFVEGESMFQDATSPWPQEVDKLDAIITSPPFFDSTRFYLANWIRLWFAGWTAEDFRIRPQAFVDERQKTDFGVYRPVLRQARERLKPDGVCVFHLGRSRKCDMASEITALASNWFRNIESFSESVSHCESHGIRDKGTVIEHSYLVLS